MSSSKTKVQLSSEPSKYCLNGLKEANLKLPANVSNQEFALVVGYDEPARPKTKFHILFWIFFLLTVIAMFLCFLILTDDQFLSNQRSQATSHSQTSNHTLTLRKSRVNIHIKLTSSNIASNRSVVQAPVLKGPTLIRSTKRISASTTQHFLTNLTTTQQPIRKVNTVISTAIPTIRPFRTTQPNLARKTAMHKSAKESTTTSFNSKTRQTSVFTQTTQAVRQTQKETTPKPKKTKTTVHRSTATPTLTPTPITTATPTATATPTRSATATATPTARTQKSIRARAQNTASTTNRPNHSTTESVNNHATTATQATGATTAFSTNFPQITSKITDRKAEKDKKTRRNSKSTELPTTNLNKKLATQTAFTFSTLPTSTFTTSKPNQVQMNTNHAHVSTKSPKSVEINHSTKLFNVNNQINSDKISKSAILSLVSQLKTNTTASPITTPLPTEESIKTMEMIKNLNLNFIKKKDVVVQPPSTPNKPLCKGSTFRCRFQIFFKEQIKPKTISPEIKEWKSKNDFQNSLLERHLKNYRRDIF